MVLCALIMRQIDVLNEAMAWKRHFELELHEQVFDIEITPQLVC